MERTGVWGREACCWGRYRDSQESGKIIRVKYQTRRASCSYPLEKKTLLGGLRRQESFGQSLITQARQSTKRLQTFEGLGRPPLGSRVPHLRVREQIN